MSAARVWGNSGNARSISSGVGKWSLPNVSFDVDVHQPDDSGNHQTACHVGRRGSPHVAQLLMPSASRRWNTQERNTPMNKTSLTMALAAATRAGCLWQDRGASFRRIGHLRLRLLRPPAPAAAGSTAAPAAAPAAGNTTSARASITRPAPCATPPAWAEVAQARRQEPTGARTARSKDTRCTSTRSRVSQATRA